MPIRVSLSILLLVLSAGIATPQSLVNLEVDSWVYPVLDRFVAKGYLYVDTEVRPLARGEIAEALVGLIVEVRDGEVRISSVDAYFLARLKCEFREELRLLGVEEVEGMPVYQDIPMVRYSHDQNLIALDADAQESIVLERTKIKDSVCVIDTTLTVSRTSIGLESYGQFGKGPAFAERLVFTKIEGDEDIGTAYPSLGMRQWKGGTAQVERAYLRQGFGPVKIQLGRDRVWWGPGRFGTLLVSSGGEALDLVGLSVSIWAFSVRGLTAVLSPDEGIYVSAHRLSLRLPLRTIFAVSEAVIYYRNSFPEPQYVNPLIPYYLAEHNLDQDDNTLWNFSLVTCPGAGIRLYGEFLIDDVQYERSANAPDKLGGIAGIHIADPLRLPDCDLRCEYTRLNKWVYTHRDSSDRYAHSGTPIGEVLGPDSDRLILEIYHRPSRLVEILLGYRYLRHGEGTVELPWEEELGDPRPPFPSGEVETCNALYTDVSFRPTWWFFLRGGVEYTRRRNSTAFGVCPEKPIDRWQWNLTFSIEGF